MKTAIISDIHGNIDALNKVLRDIKKQKCDRIFCLGDVVGYGYDPNACAAKIKEVCGKDCVLGNHDAAVIGKLGIGWFNPVAGDGVLRDRSKATAQTKGFLESLELQTADKNDNGKPNLCFTHGCINGALEFPYIQGTFDAFFAMDMMRMDALNVMFVGHTHAAVGYQVDKNEKHPHYCRIEDGPLYVDTTSQTIINVGSIGYPRNQPFSCYAIYDDEELSVTWRQLRFDFNGYCQKLRENNITIPGWMWRWVEDGLLSDEDAFGDGKEK